MTNLGEQLSNPTASSAGPPLLERGRELELLQEAIQAAAAGEGRLIFVEGEAGMGKSALVRCFRRASGAGVILIGTCDPLGTPRPLGPLLEMAPGLGPEFAAGIAASASGPDLFTALAERLTALPPPTVLVFEDIHWADQASLDLLRFVGRRIERLPALVIATLRDEASELGSPITALLGDLATSPGVTRLWLAPLSRAATSELAAGAAMNAGDLYARTGGNPFYITEVVAARGRGVPPAVRDAILARFMRFAPAVREGLAAAAAIGTRLHPELLCAILDLLTIPRWTTDTAVTAGFLDWSGSDLVFRHELARAAIAQATPPERRQQLHGLILRALREDGSRPQDLPALVEHAEAAGDAAAVLELAPLAGDQAAGLFAHREAAAFYGKALVAGYRGGNEIRASLLERRAGQAYLSGQLAQAAADYRAAADLWRELHAPARRGYTLAQLSRLLFLSGQYGEADRVASEAVTCLEQAPPGPELALTYVVRSQLALLSCNGPEAERWAQRAEALAERLGARQARLEASVARGGARLLSGADEDGQELRDAQLAAQAERLDELDVRATAYLAWLPALNRRYDDADRLLEQAERDALEHDLDYWRPLIAAVRLMCDLALGRWAHLEHDAQVLLQRGELAAVPRLTALLTLGRLKARRGQEGARAYLEQALELTKSHQRVGTVTPVWPAVVEAAWLAGDNGAALEAAGQARAEGVDAWLSWSAGDLALWTHLAGGHCDLSAEVAEPYALILAGKAEPAAELWRQRGCPYEAGVALSTSQDAGAVLQGIRLLDDLGATPAAAYARRRLRQLGVSSVPRGPNAATSANPAGLTQRELDVLGLVGSGLTNAGIAGRLFLSEKTVERHLSSIFTKLNVGTRADAVRQARRRGALPDMGGG